MSDIRIEHGLPAKPEVLVIAHELGVSSAEVIGLLVVVWLWADQTTRGGRCSHDPSIIDGLTRQGFAAAMEKVCWLTREGEGFVLPRIERYTGDGRTSRDRRLTQKERARKQKRSVSGKFENAPVDTNYPTTTDNQPIVRKPTVRPSADLGPTNTTQHNTNQHNTHTVEDVGDGDYTGENMPATRYYEVSSRWPVKINEVIDAIPLKHRRAMPKVKRSIAAALDRGVHHGALSEALREYYASDEGSGEYATWASNWIDQERYNEDPSAWTRSTSPQEVTGNAKEKL